MGELITAAQQGDPRALSELYQANFAWLYRYVRFRVSGDASAEDVCSEIFTKAFENIAKFRAKSSFKTWLFSIARNELANWYRKEKPYLPLETEVEAQHDDEGDETPESYPELEFVMAELSDRYREVLELRFLSGLSIKETAEVLEMKTNAVKVLQHRALKSAQQLAEKHYGKD